VIKTVYPKKSFDDAPEERVAFARERGVRVDRYLAEFVEKGTVTIAPGEWDEVKQRFEICAEWWEGAMAGIDEVKAQPILYSIEDGVAGTPDFLVRNGRLCVLDLKNTYNPEKAWKLQLGAAAEYANADEVCILHVSPKVHKKTGCKLIEYDAAECRELWRSAVAWWKCIQRIEA
jgi:hypothetical protein